MIGRATLDRLRAIPRDTWRDAVRRGLQSALAAVAAFLLVRAVGLGGEFLAILGAVLILQPSVGGTMGTALTRLRATVAGSLLAFAGLALLPDGWGTVAALAASMLVVGTAAGLRSDWSYGAVAATAMALAPEGEILGTALERGLGIALGAAVGVAVSLLVWPDRAERRFERHLRAALRATATRLQDAVEATMQPGRQPDPEEDVSAYHKAVGLAQEALDAAKLVDREGMRARLGALRRLYNSVIILDRAAESDHPPVEGEEALREQVELLRRDACALLTAMADGERGEDGTLEEIDGALAALRDALARDDPGSELHRSRNAVAFGLHEVRRSLAALIEAERREA